MSLDSKATGQLPPAYSSPKSDHELGGAFAPIGINSDEDHLPCSLAQCSPSTTCLAGQIETDSLGGAPWPAKGCTP
jgi:hypothetical protein